MTPCGSKCHPHNDIGPLYFHVDSFIQSIIEPRSWLLIESAHGRTGHLAGSWGAGLSKHKRPSLSSPSSPYPYPPTPGLTTFPLAPSSPGGPFLPGGPAAPDGPVSPFSPNSPLGPFAETEVRRAWTLQGPRLACLNLGVRVVWDFPRVRDQSSLDFPRAGSQGGLGLIGVRDQDSPVA